MPITPQDAAETLAALGKKPWEVSLSEDPDGAIVVTPTRTDYRGALEVGLRHMGAGAPRAIGSALAMTHGAPLIVGASALGTVTTTPIGGAIAGGATAIGLGAAGGKAADLAFGDPVRKLVLGDEAQRARDLEAHPTAAKVGDFLASAAGFKLPGRELLMGAVKAPVAAFGKAVLSGAEKEALKAAAVNAGVGGTISAGQQLYRTGTVDPGEVLGAAAESAPFGHPRDFVGGLKRGFGPAPVLAPPVAPSEATGAPASIPNFIRPAESAPPQGYEAPRPASLYEPPTVREVKALPWNEPPKPEAEAAPAPTTAPDDTYEFGQAYEQPTIARRRAGPRPQEVRGPLNPGQPESTLLQEQLLKEGSPFVQESTPATKRRAPAPEVEASEPRAEEAAEVVEPVDEVPGAPLSYEQALGQDASPVGKYMPDAKLKARNRSVLKDAPTPEPASVTAEAVRLAADPATGKKAAFIPAGSPEPALPENVVTYQRKRGAKGKVVVNPTKVTPQEVTELQNAEQVPGKLLGLSQDVKPAEAAGDFVVTDSGGQPAVMTEVVRPGEDAIEAAKAAQQAAAPGSTQRVVPGEQVLAERAAGLGKIDKALDYLESKKIDTGGTFDATAGIPAAAWNGAIDLGKLALRAGRTVAEAVEAVIAHLRQLHGERLNEAQARERLTAELNGHVARSPEQITKEFEASQAKAPVPAPEPLLESKRGAGIDGAGAGVNSLLRTAYERSKPLGEALAGFGTEQRSLAAKATSVLGNLPRDAGALANSVRLKMQNAALSNTVPEFTPEELPVAKAIGDFFKHTRETANARGHTINEQPNYFSEIVNQDIAVAMQKNSEATRAETTKRFVDYQADIAKARGQEFTPEKALEAREDWHSFLNTLGSDHTNLEGDFGALSKRARQWHLPPEFQDPDAIRAMNRYATRYSRQLAREQWIDTNPEALAALKNADQVDARHYVSGTLSTKGGSPLIGAAQRLANSAVMQTSSAIWQSIQKYNNYAAVTHDLPLLWNATMQTIKNFEAQRAGAVGEGVVKPNHDYTQGADLDIPGALAANFDKASSFLRKNSLAGALENANRIQDFTVGQQLATEALNGRNPGFLEKFNEGAHKGLTPEENRDRMAANFVEFVQGSYGAKGLPAWQLKGTPQATLFRIQRYGWENMLRTYQYTIEPAKKGDIGPLLTYMLAGAVTAPVVNKLREVLGGLPGNAKRAIEGQHVTGADIWQGRKSGLPTAREIDVATADPSTGKDQLMEYALNAMSLADLAGSYGFLGKAAGSVAGAVRGHSSAVVGDPSLSLSLSLLKTFGSAAEAIRNGEPVIPTIQTAVANGILDNMQMTRGATGDLGEVNDQRDKGVFNYLSGRHEPTVNKALMGMLVGNTFSDQAREISPTKEAAAQGDRAALLQLTPQERKSLDNYKGGFESPKLEGPHQQFLLMTQGPEALDAYRARRMDFVRRVHGASQLVR